MDQIIDVVGVAAVMLLVILASYYVTKFVSVKAGGSGRRARCLKVIDRFSVSRDKMFVLVAMGKQAYLIGITNQSMTVIDKQELSDLPLEDDQVRKPTGVHDFVSHLRNRSLKNKMGESSSAEGQSFSSYFRDAQNVKDHKDE